MAQGELRVAGTIDCAQFWPTGAADADTTKLLVATSAGAFRFRTHPGGRFRRTEAFADAVVHGRIVRPALDRGRLTVRLQGIDAPELHYRPQAALAPAAQSPLQRQTFLDWNHDFRQHWAESATWALRQLLRGAAPPRAPLCCTVVTRVDAPDEVFDCYGRLVGEILVRLGQTEVNLNTWLARQGWAFPAFYSSMSAEEIAVLREAADAAYAEGLGIWPSLQERVGRLWTSVRYRKAKPPLPADIGPLILPKLYRRQVTWTINRKAKMVDLSFRAYLKARRDACFLTSEFLEQGVTASQPRMLDEFVGAYGVVGIWPEEVVFQEAGARVVGKSGEIPAW